MNTQAFSTVVMKIAKRVCSIFLLFSAFFYHLVCTVLAYQYDMAQTNIIDQKDFRILNFGSVTKDKAMGKDIFAVYGSKTLKQCIYACTSTTGCVSYNYASNGGVCELCNDTSPCALVPKPGFIHQGVFNFRECFEVFSITVSAMSADALGQFTVGNQEFSFTDHGNNFLAVHKNGTIHESVRYFDMVHDHGETLLQMNAYINGLPDGLIVLMAVVKNNHIYHNIGQLPLLGSQYTSADLLDKQRWVLIGHKGGSQPWITEALETDSTPITRSVNIHTYY